jgi:hypothetical protein
VRYVQLDDAERDVRARVGEAVGEQGCTFLRNHGASDGYLEESGVPHVIVRPDRFLQHVTESVVPSVDPDGNFYSNEGDARLSMVHARDAAAAGKFGDYALDEDRFLVGDAVRRHFAGRLLRQGGAWRFFARGSTTGWLVRG